ncbi:hypothetical protein LEMLEM_LOCUS11076 [Lemmus lemmus]
MFKSGLSSFVFKGLEVNMIPYKPGKTYVTT